MTWASLPPHWIAENKITPVARVTSGTAPDLSADVPSMSDLLADDHDRKVLRTLSAAGEIGKPLVLQLSVPQERVQILRNAFAAMMKDPAFLADAEKLRQNVSATIGNDAVKIVDEIYSSPKDVVDAARAIAND